MAAADNWAWIRTQAREAWKYYWEYVRTKTSVHAVATAALTAFGLLAYLDPWFIALALASYLFPPVYLYLSGADLAPQPEPGESELYREADTSASTRTQSHPEDPDPDFDGPDYDYDGPDYDADGPDYDADGPDYDADGPDYDVDS